MRSTVDASKLSLEAGTFSAHSTHLMLLPGIDRAVIRKAKYDIRTSRVLKIVIVLGNEKY